MKQIKRYSFLLFLSLFHLCCIGNTYFDGRISKVDSMSIKKTFRYKFIGDSILVNLFLDTSYTPYIQRHDTLFFEEEITQKINITKHDTGDIVSSVIFCKANQMTNALNETEHLRILLRDDEWLMDLNKKYIDAIPSKDFNSFDSSIFVELKKYHGELYSFTQSQYLFFDHNFLYTICKGGMPSCEKIQNVIKLDSVTTKIMLFYTDYMKGGYYIDTLFIKEINSSPKIYLLKFRFFPDQNYGVYYFTPYENLKVFRQVHACTFCKHCQPGKVEEDNIDGRKFEETIWK